MARNEFDKVKQAETSFLSSARKNGEARKKGRPTKAAVLQKALEADSTKFFQRVLDDESEERLWKMFITGKAPQLDDRGHIVTDPAGNPFMVDIELNAISWNAFRQMVAYKRGLPTIKVDKGANGGDNITVNFNVMGVNERDMEKRVRELGLLPVSASSEV